MADISSLVKALKDKTIAQYEKGAPYRQALASALSGDTQGINQALSQSDLTPMDVATTFSPIGMTKIKISDLNLNPAGKAIANSFFMWNPKAINKVINKEPVSVVKLPDGQFHLLDGYHRVLQAEKMNKDTINVNETPMTDDIYNFLLKEGTIKD